MKVAILIVVIALVGCSPHKESRKCDAFIWRKSESPVARSDIAKMSSASSPISWTNDVTKCYIGNEFLEKGTKLILNDEKVDSNGVHYAIFNMNDTTDIQVISIRNGGKIESYLLTR